MARGHGIVYKISGKAETAAIVAKSVDVYVHGLDYGKHLSLYAVLELILYRSMQYFYSKRFVTFIISMVAIKRRYFQMSTVMCRFMKIGFLKFHLY